MAQLHLPHQAIAVGFRGHNLALRLSDREGFAIKYHA